MGRFKQGFIASSAFLATAFAIATVAGAAVVTGTGSGERLVGTNGPDVISGHAGPDRVFALGGDDTLNGNLGADRMFAGRGNDRSFGGFGDDVIFAQRGVDESFGGPGNDRLWALARADVRRPGVDTLHGEEGDDVFRTRDGEPDVIDCGAGSDRALLDRVDVIADATTASPNGSCEIVKRRKAGKRANRKHGKDRLDEESRKEDSR
jgi:Ca2+-binding RTX toxin-like protein